MQTDKLHNTIKPLVKWTGGKYEEYPKFAAHIPSFDHYYEPFFGGGGVFFALQPAKQSYLNDRSEDLITFYRSLSDPEFKRQAFDLVSSWQAISDLYEDLATYIVTDFDDFLTGILPQESLFAKVDNYFGRVDVRELIRSIAVFKAIDPSTLLLFLHDSIIDKFRRIKRIVAREQRTFDHPALQDHIETALRSGFYMYMRQVMNQRKYVLQHPQTHTAIWYFVRELCYGSMFRFNAKGEFNIPYGGIAYNRKNLRAKVQALFQDSVEQLFGRSQIFNLDFEEFLTKTKATESDFIFLDPPYDSEFSEYDRNAFTRQDQLRLRDCLHRQTAKWMMVIKETTFIRNIYKEIDANFIDFDKTYMYNVRGRNNRDTKHLIITNYLPHNISK